MTQQEAVEEHGSFQCACGDLTLCGDIEPTCIIDPTCPPSNIIPSCTDFWVEVKWEIYGTVVPLMAGDFKVTAAFEAIGASGPNTSVSDKVPVLSGKYSTGSKEGPERDYKDRLLIKNSTNLLPPGVYLLVAYITYTDANGNPGPIAGMSDEKFVEIFPKPPSS